MQMMLRRAELAALVERFVPAEGMSGTPVPGLHLARATQGGQKAHTLYQPALCLLAQGRKRVQLAQQAVEYDPMQHLVISQALPVVGEVIGAADDAPYLGVRIDIAPRDIAALMLDVGRPPAPPDACMRGLFTGHTSAALLDAVLRLVRLIETPHDVAALAPLVMREIHYRLLMSEHGWRLAQVATPDTQSQRIARAIAWLHERYREPLRIEAMAKAVHMSVSSLHHRFKAVTAMSPLQYQKHLRLQEARRMMLSEGLDAATAGHRVGYESPSQFSREYARTFGAPPARDIRELRRGSALPSPP